MVQNSLPRTMNNMKCLHLSFLETLTDIILNEWISAMNDLVNHMHVATVDDYYAACKQSTATRNAKNTKNCMFSDFSRYFAWWQASDTSLTQGWQRMTESHEIKYAQQICKHRGTIKKKNVNRVSRKLSLTFCQTHCWTCTSSLSCEPPLSQQNTSCLRQNQLRRFPCELLRLKDVVNRTMIRQ